MARKTLRTGVLTAKWQVEALRRVDRDAKWQVEALRRVDRGAIWQVATLRMGVLTAKWHPDVLRTGVLKAGVPPDVLCTSDWEAFGLGLARFSLRSRGKTEPVQCCGTRFARTVLALHRLGLPSLGAAGFEVFLGEGFCAGIGFWCWCCWALLVTGLS
jgi:hypothetical protein